VRMTAPLQIRADSELSAATWHASAASPAAIHLSCDAQRLAAMAWDAGRGPWAYLVMRDQQSFFGTTAGPVRIPWHLELVDQGALVVRVRLSPGQCEAWLADLLVPPHVPTGLRVRVERLLVCSRPPDVAGERRIDVVFAGRVELPLPMSMRAVVQAVTADAVIRWDASTRQVTECRIDIGALDGDLLGTGDLDLFRAAASAPINKALKRKFVGRAIPTWVPMDATVDVLVEASGREL